MNKKEKVLAALTILLFLAEYIFILSFPIIVEQFEVSLPTDCLCSAEEPCCRDLTNVYTVTLEDIINGGDYKKYIFCGHVLFFLIFCLLYVFSLLNKKKQIRPRYYFMMLCILTGYMLFWASNMLN